MALKFESLCCIRLTSAGLVVGFLTSIVSFMNVVDLIGALIAFDDREPGFHMNSHASIEIIGWELLGYFLVLLSGCLLILGVIKESHRMILPWLILSVFEILYGIGFIVFVLIFGMEDEGKSVVLFLLVILIFVVLGVYTWIGILSLYTKIRDKKQEAIAQVEAEKLYSPPNSYSQPVMPSNYPC